MNFSCLKETEVNCYTDAFNRIIYAYYIRTNQDKKAVKSKFEVSSQDLAYIIEKGLKLEPRDFQMLDLLLANKTLDYRRTVHALFRNPQYGSNPSKVAEALNTNVLDILYILSETIELSYEQYVELNQSFKKGVY